jgi:glycosyltransferase involved in cell wall biosynthesis
MSQDETTVNSADNPDRNPSDDPAVVVVMPAYNAALTLAETEASIPAGLVSKVILVDDHSHDDTVPVAKELGVEVIVHPHNVGYGGNQKTCYMAALRGKADIVVMLHPDGQYDPELLPAMIEPIANGEADMTLGSRFLRPGGPRIGGMPRYKIAANRLLTTVENYVLGTHFSELHTGYRAYSRKFLETVPFLRNSNDFVFDTQVIAQAVSFEMRVKEVPIVTKYFPEASSTTLRQSIVYGCKTLLVMLRYRLHASARLKAAIFLP